MNTTGEANVELLQRGFALLSAGDIDACCDLIGPDLVINLAELPSSRSRPSTRCQMATVSPFA